MKQHRIYRRHISVSTEIRNCVLLTTCCLGLIVLVGCAAQVKTADTPKTTPPPAAEDTAAVAVEPRAKRPVPPKTLAVEQWVGHAFAALPLSPTFSRFGYELYPTADLGNESSPVDPQRQLDNHRYRYEALAGKTLTAEEVTVAGSEYLVRFVTEDDSWPVFGKTHKHAIKGLALRSDLAAARKRWQGGTVHARTRQINTYDSTSGKMGSVSVSILTPLQVQDVRWGFGPLPPQPLWLIVSTPDGTEGFVPVQVSWTNVLSDKVRQFAPWTEFILEDNPRETYDWDDAMWAQIDAHKLATGMTTDQVRLSWGEPQSREAIADDQYVSSRWTYAGQVLLFENGVLTATEPR